MEVIETETGKVREIETAKVRKAAGKLVSRASISNSLRCPLRAQWPLSSRYIRVTYLFCPNTPTHSQVRSDSAYSYGLAKGPILTQT